MRLLTGPPGSGKTALILEEFRRALRAGQSGIRLVTPTATLAQHLQNRIARDGFVFRHSFIQTLSGFVDTFAGDVPQAPDAVLHLLVEEAVHRANRPEFERVAQFPGFSAALAKTISEFASAGCDSARLAAFQPGPPLGPAFVAVYHEVDQELERRGLALRAKRLLRAAGRIATEGTGGIGAVWFDGFHALPDPELALMEALARHAPVTLTLSDADITSGMRARLMAMGFREEPMTRSRPQPATVLVKAPNLEREIEETARRILEQAAAGRQFREMGIVVRAGQTYVPVLQTTLERFGIPARFYSESKLEEHPAVRLLGGAVDAMLGGWDHTATLAVLRLAPRFADSSALDRLDFAVREQAPNAGLGGLKALLLGADGRPFTPGAERLLHKIDSLAALEEWRSFRLSPKDWAARLGLLRNLFRASAGQAEALPDVAGSQAAALEMFDEALGEAAMAAQPDHLLELEEFWRKVKAVLRLKRLREDDGRRNVVHVLDAHEARQWVLPVVFVCGLVEKQFPQPHQPGAFFPESERQRLSESGIRVRTASEFSREERALYDSAVSRATMLTVLSYPEFDGRGERTLPSLFLEGLAVEEQSTRPVRPAPRHTLQPRTAPAIRAPDLLAVIREKSVKQSPSALETYLQCPFQYFSKRMLRLRPAPKRPEKRLDFMTQGSIVHEVLAKWWADPVDVTPLFDSVFERFVDEHRIPQGYHTERIRNGMLDDLRAFTSQDTWPRGEHQSQMEQSFVLPLDGLEISGKIDRLDIGAGGRAYVIDYKYSRPDTTKDKLENPNLLQAPLYLIAAERVMGAQPAGMFYIGLRGKVQYAGWSDSALMGSNPLPENWLRNAAERTLAIVEEIRGGRIDVKPADRDFCRLCDYHDICRVDAPAAVVLAGRA